jgi:hypothetical protein
MAPNHTVRAPGEPAPDGTGSNASLGHIAARFGCPYYLTVNTTGKLRLYGPDSPVTVIVAAPVAAPEETASVRVDVALPPAAGVTVMGANAAVTPAGRPAALSVVAGVKPFWLAMVNVMVPLLPRATVRLPDEAFMVNVAGGMVTSKLKGAL